MCYNLYLLCVNVYVCSWLKETVGGGGYARITVCDLAGDRGKLCKSGTVGSRLSE